MLKNKIHSQTIQEYTKCWLKTIHPSHPPPSFFFFLPCCVVWGNLSALIRDWTQPMVVKALSLNHWMLGNSLSLPFNFHSDHRLCSVQDTLIKCSECRNKFRWKITYTFSPPTTLSILSRECWWPEVMKSGERIWSRSRKSASLLFGWPYYRDGSFSTDRK